jgi:hypothetical protein
MVRNRAQGWKHAKLTGHSNEKAILDRINSDSNFKAVLAKRLSISEMLVGSSIGGLHETLVLDVFGGKTKSKTDLVLEWHSNKRTNISIKKSVSGQVYLIGVQRFIDGFERQFKKEIPPDVKRAIQLFIAGAADMKELLASQKMSIGIKASVRKYEQKKQRLTWQSLEKYNNELSESLIDWFRRHIRELTLFCFQRGLVQNREEWADFVWYHSEVEVGAQDSFFNIDEMSEEMTSKKSIEQILPGTRGGGTTIQLPFGFLQWHQSQIQFHHKFLDLQKNCKTK